MRALRIPQNTFQFGEVSPATIMRTDSPIYMASGQSLQNMMILAEGGVKKRPGLKFTADLGIARDSSKRMQCRLIPFIYDENEQYIISLEDAQVRCFRVTDSAVTLVSTLTQDTDTDAIPFDDDFLHEYTYSQFGDTLIVCHPVFLPRMIVRTSLTSFEVRKFAFDVRADNEQIYQPYSQFHPTGVTLSVNATSGNGRTLTTSASYWEAGHVGTIVRYGENEIQITAVTNGTTATGNIVGTLRRRLEVIDPLRTSDGSSVVEVTHIAHGFAGGESITVEGAGSVGGISAANINGSRTVGTILDANTYTITAGASATSSADGGGLIKIVTGAATDDWSEQSFSSLRGYPAAVTFHENRLVFGGTLAEPDTLWFSKSAEFFNFDVGDAEDNDSINLVASIGKVSNIRYLVSTRDLQVFTDSGEFYVPAFLNQALTPTNAQIRTQTPYGTEFVTPRPFDGATLFVQTGGKVVREYLYTDSEDAYASTAISTIASHLIVDPKDSAVVHGAFDLAESYAVFINNDGTAAVFGSNRVEQRAGWVPWTGLDGFHSVAAVDERLFFAVWGDTNLYLTEMTGDVGVDNWLYKEIDTTPGENLWTWTGHINDGTANVWSSSGTNLATFTGGQADPLGGTDAFLANTFNTGFGTPQTYEILKLDNGTAPYPYHESITYTASIYFKAKDDDWIYIDTDFFTTPADGRQYINIATGALGTATGGFSSAITTTVVDAGGGWFRVILTFTTGATTSLGQLTFGGATADTTPGVICDGVNQPFYIFGPQIQIGSAAGPYVEAEGSTGSAYTTPATYAVDVSDAYSSGDTPHVIGVNSSTGATDYIGQLTVSAGLEIDMSAYSGYGYDYVYAGNFYVPEIKTNPIDLQINFGTMTGDVRGIKSVIVDFVDTRTALVNNRQLVTTPGIGMTGKKRFWMSGYSEDPYVIITQSYPMPLQINGLITELLI